MNTLIFKAWADSEHTHMMKLLNHRFSALYLNMTQDKAHQGSRARLPAFRCSSGIYCVTLGKSPNVSESSLSSVQLLSCVRLFVTPWTAARQASLSITNSWSLPNLVCYKCYIGPRALNRLRPCPKVFAVGLSEADGKACSYYLVYNWCLYKIT